MMTGSEDPREGPLHHEEELSLPSRDSDEPLEGFLPVDSLASASVEKS